jgi:hypothetical protein
VAYSIVPTTSYELPDGQFVINIMFFSQEYTLEGVLIIWKEQR